MIASLSELIEIERTAQAMLKTLATASPATILLTLLPRPEDYGAVFVGDAAERARFGYVQLWAKPPGALAKPGQTEVHAMASHAEALSGETEFPGGYRGIAHLLVPGVVWLRFKYTKPTESVGMAYDGLVWRDGRWAWFPKPWRVIADDLTVS